jgi:hypothetical protein
VTVRLRLLATVFAALLLAAAPAFASLADEVTAGQTVVARLQSGKAACQSLTASDFEHLGEYVMEHMVGSRSIHAALNPRMDRMMGSENTDRMHELLGGSYAGCTTAAAGTMPMGPGMMGGGGVRGWGAMMSSSAWSWMHDGAWQHMSRADWRQLATTMMGPRTSFGSEGGWSTGAVLATVLGGLALAAVILMAVLRRSRRP